MAVWVADFRFYFYVNNDEANYGSGVSQLLQWCKGNELFLNVGKTGDCCGLQQETPN